MFIRKTIKNIKKKEYVQYQLIRAIRTANGPRQEILLNLGQLELPKEKHKELANRIEALINKQQSLFKTESEVEKFAVHYANIIIKQKAIEQKQDEEEIKEKTIIEKIDLTTITHTEVKTIGVEHIILEQMKEYKFTEILEELGWTKKQIDYAKMLIIGRVVSAGSEKHTVRWVEEISGIKEMLKIENKVNDMGLHRTAIEITESYEKIETALRKKAKEVFSLKEKILLYDLTNTYFQGKKGDSKIKQYGHSKEKRNAQPLATLALVIDDEGFPKQSRILPGNIGETKTIDGILDKLTEEKENWLTKEKTIVMDAGIASQENLEKIKNKGMNYIAISKSKQNKEDVWKTSQTEEVQLKNNKYKLKVKTYKTETEVFLLCESEAKLIKGKAIIESKIKKFELGLKTLKENLNKKGTIKKYELVLEKIGRLKEIYKVGKYYDIKIIQENNIVQDIEYKQTENITQLTQAIGKYIIRTNRLDLSAEEISQIHRSLTTIEESFSCMKSDLGLRPNYHQNDKSIIAHMNITVLAYHMVCAILKKLEKQGINHNLKTIKEDLQMHIRLTTTMKTEANQIIYMRKNSTPTIKQDNIYNVLKITNKPLAPKIIKSLTDVVSKKYPQENNH